MSQSRRLLFYIVINILVSACTTLAVLWLWDRTHSSTPFTLGQAAQPTSSVDGISPSSLTPSVNEVTPASPPQPDSSGKIILIDNVFGAGDLANEVVLIKRAGDGALNLTGWQLDGAAGNNFTFPSLDLYKDGAVQIHTTAGVNTVVDLYWGLDEAVWHSGDTINLLDPQGQVYATYRIP